MPRMASHWWGYAESKLHRIRCEVGRTFPPNSIDLQGIILLTTALLWLCYECFEPGQSPEGYQIMPFCAKPSFPGRSSVAH